MLLVSVSWLTFLELLPARPGSQVLILTKLGTHIICANTQKTTEQIFKILSLKFLANFLNVEFGLSLWNISSRLAGLSGYVCHRASKHHRCQL